MPRSGALISSSTTSASIGSAFPFKTSGPRERQRKLRALRAVRSEVTICPGSAACSSRAATLIASPATSASPGGGSTVATASPVFTPMRISSSIPCRARRSSLTRASRRCMRIAARSARDGSSSCASGAPNTAMTASPANFSTVPPSASISSRMATK